MGLACLVPWWFFCFLRIGQTRIGLDAALIACGAGCILTSWGLLYNIKTSNPLSWMNSVTRWFTGSNIRILFIDREISFFPTNIVDVCHSAIRFASTTLTLNHWWQISFLHSGWDCLWLSGENVTVHHFICLDLRWNRHRAKCIESHVFILDRGSECSFLSRGASAGLTGVFGWERRLAVPFRANGISWSYGLPIEIWDNFENVVLLNLLSLSSTTPRVVIRRPWK